MRLISRKHWAEVETKIHQHDYSESLIRAHVFAPSGDLTRDVLRLIQERDVVESNRRKAERERPFRVVELSGYRDRLFEIRPNDNDRDIDRCPNCGGTVTFTVETDVDYLQQVLVGACVGCPGFGLAVG